MSLAVVMNKLAMLLALLLAGGLALTTSNAQSDPPILVNNPDDSAPGSLREAIMEANNDITNPGADTIVFDRAALSGQTIVLTSGDRPLLACSPRKLELDFRLQSFCSAHGANCRGRWPSDVINEARRAVFQWKGSYLTIVLSIMQAVRAAGIATIRICPVRIENSTKSAFDNMLTA